MSIFFTSAISVFAQLRNVTGNFVLLGNGNYVTNILTLLIYLRLLLQKNMPAKAAGQGTKPPILGAQRASATPVAASWMSGCRPDFWSSIFLKNFFRRIFVPKAQEKHFMMSRSDFFHGFWCHENAKNAQNACFWAKNNIQNAVGGVCVRQNFFFLKFDQFAIWRTHLPNLEFWGGPTGTRNTILRKNVSQKTRPLRPKNDN